MNVEFNLPGRAGRFHLSGPEARGRLLGDFSIFLLAPAFTTCMALKSERSYLSG